MNWSETNGPQELSQVSVTMTGFFRSYFLPIPIIDLISPIELKIGERPEKSGSEIGFLGEDPNIDIYHPSIGI